MTSMTRTPAGQHFTWPVFTAEGRQKYTPSILIVAAVECLDTFWLNVSFLIFYSDGVVWVSVCAQNQEHEFTLISDRIFFSIRMIFYLSGQQSSLPAVGLITRLYVSQNIHPFISLSIHVAIHQLVCPHIFLSACPSVCLLIGPVICPSVHLSLYLSVCASMCSTRVSVSLSTNASFCVVVSWPVCPPMRLSAC